MGIGSRAGRVVAVVARVVVAPVVVAGVVVAATVAATLIATAAAAAAQGVSERQIATWAAEFPLTDFAKTTIDLGEIVTDGPLRDQIPPINEPTYIAVGALGEQPSGPGERPLDMLEPVVSISINGDARAYPVRILIFHEIVNDTVGGTPILVSYCPLCNSAVVFDRRLDGETLTFGNTGRIRRYNMVMYDRESESWWQQFSGEAIIGSLSAKILSLVPARVESLQRFIERAPNGKILVPTDKGARPYGLTPYAGYNDRDVPLSLSQTRFPYDLPDGVNPLERLVVVGNEAWPVDLVRREGAIEGLDFVIRWEPGQKSTFDTTVIAKARDVGNIVAQRKAGGRMVDIPYDVSFAFAFAAFRPDGVVHTTWVPPTFRDRAVAYLAAPESRQTIVAAVALALLVVIGGVVVALRMRRGRATA